jgi:DNA repair protein RecO (recombination protein O)
MDERATGLILRTYPLTESSLIVHWLTAEQGRIATVAKGARRAKSPLRGKLDLFFRADFSFHHSHRSELHTLREIRLLETYPGLRADLGRLQQVAYCAALIEQSTETETPLAPYFALFKNLLAFIAEQPPRPTTILAFEMKFLSESGLQPDLSTSPLNEGTRQILELFTHSQWSHLTRIALSEAQLTETRLFLKSFIAHHLGKIPRGRDEALSVTAA